MISNIPVYQCCTKQSSQNTEVGDGQKKKKVNKKQDQSAKKIVHHIL